MQQPEPPKSSHSRPSLLSPSDAGDSGHARILGSVPGTSTAAPKPMKKRVGLLLLGLGLVAATWGLLSRPGQTSSHTAPLATSTPAVPAPPPPPPAAASETIAVADTTPTPPAAATITDAPTAASPASTASKDDPNALSTVLEAGVAVPPDTLKSALSAKPAPHPPPAKPKPAVARTEPAKAAPEHGPPSVATAKVVPSDNDVDLISALMAHSGGQLEPKPAPRPKKPAAHTGGPDIVERHGGDSTATLLKRCKRLGGTEAKLCSRRICTGHESEAACKAK